MALRPLHVARDVAIVFILTFFGGFVIGFAGGEGPRRAAAIAISHVLFAIVAFTITGALSAEHRWQQLRAVALFAWLFSVINIPLMHISVIAWLGGSIFVALTMVIGGGLSYFFVRTPSVSAPPPQVASIPPASGASLESGADSVEIPPRLPPI